MKYEDFKQHIFVKDINSIMSNYSLDRPLPEILQEAKQMFVYSSKNPEGYTNKVPKVIETPDDFKILEETLERIQSYTDRAVRMKIDVYEVFYKLEKIWKYAQGKLLEYKEYTTLKTNNQRDNFARTVFKPFYSYYMDLKTCLKLIDMVLDNLQSSYYITKAKFDLASLSLEKFKNV